MPCKEDTRRDIVVSIIHSTHACKLIYDNETASERSEQSKHEEQYLLAFVHTWYHAIFLHKIEY